MKNECVVVNIRETAMRWRPCGVTNFYNKLLFFFLLLLNDKKLLKLINALIDEPSSNLNKDVRLVNIDIFCRLSFGFVDVHIFIIGEII